MKQTDKLFLNKPEISDDVQDTIVKLADNFQTLDDSHDLSIETIESHLDVGSFYEKGKKFWNKNPSLGGNVGWVNTRDGIYAPDWSSKSTYTQGDLVTKIADNSHYYECIASGTSATLEPVFPTETDSTVKDIAGSTTWEASYVYSLNDIVIATSGDDTYYFECIVAGTSGAIEPDWTFSEGVTISDGSVTWQVYKTIVWKEKGLCTNFVAFSYITESERTYVFNQTSPSDTWNIIHNLGKYPQLTVIDSENEVVYGNISYVDKNAVKITFSMPISGSCYFN